MNSEPIYAHFDGIGTVQVGGERKLEREDMLVCKINGKYIKRPITDDEWKMLNDGKLAFYDEEEFEGLIGVLSTPEKEKK
jgi:hypothetical protein